MIKSDFLKEQVAAESARIVELRRWFHSHPELGMQEHNTAAKIRAELDALGIANSTIAETGVVAVIEGAAESASPEKTVALRADMDALPVEELNQVDYKSQNSGISHACGHDSHMAALLGAAAVLNRCKDKFSGTVKLFFQPGEELLAGAKKIIEEGGLDGVDSIFGLHLMPDIPCGQLSIDYGARMSSADYFDIDVIGKGGHGGFPHLATDPIMITSSIVQNLQSIVSREVNPQSPAVVSVCKFNAGTKSNIIPDRATLAGTIRTYDETTRDSTAKSVERIAENIAKAHGGTIEYRYSRGTAPTVNHSCSVDLAREVAVELFGENSLADYPPVTGAEDFALYLQRVPGAFIFVGCGNEKEGACYPLHSSRYNIDEDALSIAALMHCSYALKYLE